MFWFWSRTEDSNATKDDDDVEAHEISSIEPSKMLDWLVHLKFANNQKNALVSSKEQMDKSSIYSTK